MSGETWCKSSAWPENITLTSLLSLTYLKIIRDAAESINSKNKNVCKVMKKILDLFSKIYGQIKEI